MADTPVLSMLALKRFLGRQIAFIACSAPHMGYAHGGLQATNPTDSVAPDVPTPLEPSSPSITPEDTKTTTQQNYGRNAAMAQRFKIKIVD
jgi:hypothetical protein